MNKSAVKSVLIVLMVLFPLMHMPTQPVTANGSGFLGSSLNFQLQGDVTAAGVGLRGTGTGSITLTTIPGGATVYRAYLYWATLGTANTYTSPTLNGTRVAGRLIGTSGDTCWGVQHNFVYRADVTDLVDGNGTYTVAGLPSSLTSGNDSQGASLVVVYNSTALPFRTIVINDGAVSLDRTQNSYTNNLGGFVVDQPLTNAHITYLIGDGQATWDSGNISFNGTPIATDILSGVDGQFWGTHNFTVTNLMNEAPVTTTINNRDPANPNAPDCLLWAASILSVTSPAPDISNALTPFFQRSMHGDVTVTGVGLRGSGQGNLMVNALPAGAPVFRAYLYWATIGSSGQYTSPRLNGTTVSGSVIGVSADTCWGALRNTVYRADVTSLVAGNGAYRIDGLPNDLNTGDDSQGAALVIIYSSPLPRTIIINDGAVTLDLTTHAYTDTIGPFTANQPNAQTHITYMIGDGQSTWDSGSVDFEGVNIANNVFTGVDGPHWGTLNFDVTGLITEPEATTTINNNDPDNPTSPDCLLWAGTVLAVETEEPLYPYTYYFPFMQR